MYHRLTLLPFSILVVPVRITEILGPSASENEKWRDFGGGHDWRPNNRCVREVAVCGFTPKLLHASRQFLNKALCNCANCTVISLWVVWSSHANFSPTSSLMDYIICRYSRTFDIRPHRWQDVDFSFSYLAWAFGETRQSVNSVVVSNQEELVRNESMGTLRRRTPVQVYTCVNAYTCSTTCGRDTEPWRTQNEEHGDEHQHKFFSHTRQSSCFFFYDAKTEAERRRSWQVHFCVSVLSSDSLTRRQCMRRSWFRSYTYVPPHVCHATAGRLENADFRYRSLVSWTRLIIRNTTSGAVSVSCASVCHVPRVSWYYGRIANSPKIVWRCVVRSLSCRTASAVHWIRVKCQHVTSSESASNIFWCPTRRPRCWSWMSAGEWWSFCAFNPWQRRIQRMLLGAGKLRQLTYRANLVECRDLYKLICMTFDD